MELKQINQCCFLAIWFFLVSKEISAQVDKNFFCPDQLNYRRWNLHTEGITVDTRSSITFETKGRNDAHILLQRNRNDFDNDVIVIVLGGWNNSLSVIRNRRHGAALSKFHGPVLNASIFNSFWISWGGGCVEVGKGSIVGTNKIMNACNVTDVVTGISISFGFGSSGYFKFAVDECANNPCQNGGQCINGQNMFTCVCSSGWTGTTCQTDKTFFCPDQFNYRRWNLHAEGITVDTRSSITFEAKGRNDAIILLQRNRNDFDNDVIVIVLGGWNNSLSVIRNRRHGAPLSKFQGPVLNASSFNSFWISWGGGCVEVGIGSIVGTNKIMNTCNVTDVVTGIRITFGFGSSGYFKFAVDDCANNPCQNGGQCINGQNMFTCVCSSGWTGTTCQTDKTFFCPDQLNYRRWNLHAEGITVDTRSSITFETKGRNDAIILLQRNRNDFDNDVIVIVLGGWNNSLSVIRNRRHGAALSKFQGPVLNASSFNSFWISWGGGCVEVGKGSIVGTNKIMNACNVTDVVTGISISFGFGSSGYFKFAVDDCANNPCQNGGQCINGQNMFTCVCSSGWTGTTCQTEFVCNPDNTIDVSNLPANYSYFAMQNVTSGLDVECNVTDTSSTSIQISGCSKDFDILLTYSTYSRMSPNTLHGGKSFTAVIVRCSEIPENGTEHSVNNTFEVDLIVSSDTVVAPTYSVGSSLSTNSTTVGSDVTWTIIFPEEYILEVTSCTAYPGTDDSSSVSVSLISDGGCTLTDELISNFTDHGNGSVTATILAFKFYDNDYVFLQCDLKVCPNDSSACYTQCSRMKRSVYKRGVHERAARDAPDNHYTSQVNTVLRVVEPEMLNGATQVSSLNKSMSFAFSILLILLFRVKRTLPFQIYRT